MMLSTAGVADSAFTMIFFRTFTRTQLMEAAHVRG
jgi:hypothetical protein